MEEAELLDRLRLVGEAFRPAAPIDRRGLFSGRAEQIAELFSVVTQPGQHAVIYGERGVGKTSLALVLAEMLVGSNILVTRAICDSGDDYDSIWHKALSEIGMQGTTSSIGFAPAQAATREPASRLLGSGHVTPHDVHTALGTIAKDRPLAVIVDEFDRLRDADARALFADTIKSLSDRVVPATLVLVGVADTVDDLIREHRSVERALVQVPMPRMSGEELSEIAAKGMKAARMTIEKAAVAKIAALSQGLPHYTHLLSQLAAQAALAERRSNVGSRDVDAAVERAIERAQASVAEKYLQAVAGNGVQRHVLVACALAPEDEFGFFAAGGVEESLGSVKDAEQGESLERTLLGLAEQEVLQRRGEGGASRYRFLNPLLQPYVVMRALSDGLVKPRDLR